MHRDDVLEGADYELEMNSLALRIDLAEGVTDAPSVQKTARILHEFDHLVRMIGTSYGLVRYSLSSLYLHNFLDAFQRAGAVEHLQLNWKEVANRVPAAMTRDEFDTVYFHEKAFGATYRAQSFRSAIRMLDGHDLGQVSFGQLASWTEALIRLGGTYGFSQDEFHVVLESTWKHPRPGSRLIYINGKPLRVADILEYLGVFIEVAYRTQYSKEPLDFPSELSAKQYLQILNVIRHYIPDAIDQVNGRMAQETECLLELALWPPVGPGIRPTELAVSGVDLLPSYRLHHILQACSELDWKFCFDSGSVSELDIGPRCMELQRRICSHLNWHPPWEIAPLWVSLLTEIEQKTEDGWVKHLFHHPRSRRTTWTKQLLNDCGSAPVVGAMRAGPKHYGRIGFPVYFDTSAPERGYVANSQAQWPEADDHYRSLDVLLFGATAAAPRPDDWSWVPEIVQREAVEMWPRTPLGQNELN